jgi:hypothetical protein
LSPLHLVVIGVVGIVACWLLATPRNAGPDEPSHLVASAALVRGHASGPIVDLGYPAEQFRVPAMVGEPNPGCYAFQSDQTADCAPAPASSTALDDKYSTSANYPIWGHLLPGLASFVPSASLFAYLARALNASLAVALLVGALLRARRRPSPWLAVGLVVGFTPIAWFSLSIVSPSALAIAGATAVWVAMLSPEDGHLTLLVAGWCAILLPRRDGPLWATLVVGFACIAAAERPSAWWARLGRRARLFVLCSLPLPLLSVLLHDGDRLNTALALAPLALPIADLMIGWGRRHVGERRMRQACVLGAVGLAVLAIAAANVVRAAGPDGTLTLHIISNTGRHLRQLVGVLGWLDAPIPEVLVLLWWVAIGCLFGLALIGSPRHALIGASILATTVVVAWVLEIGSGDTTANYWQGRYSIPLAIGVPLVLASGVRVDAATARRLITFLFGSVWVLWNVAFVAALHRWGSGISGTWVVWRWHDWHQPGPIVLFIVVHALASGLLLFGRHGRADILDGS